MSSNVAAEKLDIYNLFYEVAEDLEVEFDAEGLWFFNSGRKALGDAADDVTETHKQGVLAISYREINYIAAIAFCDAAESGALELDVYDYAGAGGERYEDD